MDPIVSPEWLTTHLGDLDVAIADCRCTLSDLEAGRRAHAAGHIPGAVYFHLEEDLSSPEAAHGGRHPLPDPDVLARKLGAAGIGPGVSVVAYDDNGSPAPRFWWLLRYLGHDDVAVLNGGLPAWLAAGGELTAEPSHPRPRTFTPHSRSEMTVGMAEVKHRSPRTILLDARAPERYRGEVEPLDPVPGRIPGAINAWWEQGLDTSRAYLPAAAQKERFAKLVGDAPAVVACGSGVTACADLLALAVAGRWDVPLYVGSYSDWLSYPDNPIERGQGATDHTTLQ